MSELSLKGKIKLIGELQTFGSGFVKREIVITTDDQYPQDVKFDLLKAKAENFEQYNQVGDAVEAKFNIRGNEYQGKYYVSLQAWYISKLEQPAAASYTRQKPTEQVTNDGQDDLPF